MNKFLAKATKIGKGYGVMDRDDSLLNATYYLDIERIRACLQKNPESIRETNGRKNNAMHLCVIGGAEARPKGREIMIFYIEETEIDLLQENDEGLNPLELAFAYGDEGAVDLLYDPTNAQLDERYPLSKDRPNLKIIQGGKADKSRFPSPGGS